MAERGGAARRSTRTLPSIVAFIVAVASASVGAAEPVLAAATAEAVEEIEDYDPWEPFNERMFWFNHDVLDRFLLKPVATAWDKVLPDPVQGHLAEAFDNIEMPRRLVNNLLQRRARGAGREVARFTLNTTVGVAGLFDVAKGLGIEASDADTGQTLGMYGAGPGPYLVLPFLPPLTVRDGIGYAVDGLLDPFGYVIPGGAGTVMTVVNRVNDRSRNLALFEDVEESVIDLYSAARNAYLQQRRHAIEEVVADGEESSNGAPDGPPPRR